MAALRVRDRDGCEFDVFFSPKFLFIISGHSTRGGCNAKPTYQTSRCRLRARTRQGQSAHRDQAPSALAIWHHGLGLTCHAAGRRSRPDRDRARTRRKKTKNTQEKINNILSIKKYYLFFIFSISFIIDAPFNTSFISSIVFAYYILFLQSKQIPPISI